MYESWASVLDITQVFNTSSTVIAAVNTDGTVTRLSGTGFTFDATGALTGGTVTAAMRMTGDGANMLESYTGISCSAVQLAALAQEAQNMAQLMRPILLNVMASGNVDVTAINETSTYSQIVFSNGEIMRFYGASPAIGADTVAGHGTVTSMVRLAADGVTVLETTGPITGNFASCLGIFNDTAEDLSPFILIQESNSNYDRYSVYGFGGLSLYLSGGNHHIGLSNNGFTDLNYILQPDGIVVDMNAHTVTRGTQVDTFSGVGSVSVDGSMLSDTMTASSGGAEFYGNFGNDFLYGGTGSDMLDGGAGSDTLQGGAGNDYIIYDAADNAANVNGGADFDTLIVENSALPLAYNLAAGSFEQAQYYQSNYDSSQWWSEITTLYNQGWQAQSQFGWSDNGDSWQTQFDAGNATWYASVEEWYNPSYQKTYTNYIKDDGLRVNQAWDYTGNEWWSYFTNYFDAQNHITNTDGVANDGRYWSSTNDVNDTQWWSNYTVWYDMQDPVGRQEINVEGVANDGRHWTTTYDIYDQYAWTEQTNWFDTQGNLIETVTI